MTNQSDYLSKFVSCIKCRKEKPIKGIFTHFDRAHCSEEIKKKYRLGFTKEDRDKLSANFSNERERKINEYTENPKFCYSCNDILQYDKRNNKFCSSSCAATENNKTRDRSEQNIKTSITVSLYWKNKLETKREFMKSFVGPLEQKLKRQSNHKKPTKRKIIPDYIGEYSRVFFCSCKFCRKMFTKTSAKTICDMCRENQHKVYFIYRFKFNVYDYPELFDLDLLRDRGWFSPNGKYGKWNPNGISRDHRVSVNDATINGYDPYYITHPLNCNLMTHTENNKKKTKSSINYIDLVKLVDEYEKLRKSDSN